MSVHITISTYVIVNACTTAGLALLDQQCVPIGQTTVSIQTLELGGSTKGSLTSFGPIFKLVLLRNRICSWRWGVVHTVEFLVLFLALVKTNA